MRIKVLLLLILISVGYQAIALRAMFDYKVFEHPTDGPYVECVVSFDGSTFQLAEADSGLYMSKVELVIIISRLDEIVDFKKVNINGPLVSKNHPEDFMSLERFLLPNGIYQVELEITDLVNQGSEPEVIRQKMEVNNRASGVFISDIEFISAYRKTEEENAFSKAGYDMIPYMSGYFPTEVNTAMFYTEIYRTADIFGVGEPFVYSLAVLNSANEEVESTKKIKREKSAVVIPVIQSISIADLKTGEYRLRVEIRNRENIVVATKFLSFSRSQIAPLAEDELTDDRVVANSFAARYTDRTQLYKLIEAHTPIANGLDRITISNQLKDAELPVLQSFLYSFWVKRNRMNPEAEWLAYEKQIKEVDETFGNGKTPGWKTDRGRVYLQYGPPNTRAIRYNEPDYFPFEIWHYYETNDKQHDRRFLFYSSDRGMDMELLHSDVPNEIKNYHWKEIVRSRPAALNMSQGSINNADQKQDPFSRDLLENLWFTPH